jgi:hypothetical protein
MRRPHKYGARKSACRQGHTHDSAKEARHCNDLHLMLNAGEIEDLRLQEQFWFVIDGKQLKHDNGRRVGVKIDFTYTDRHSGKRIADDTKGFVVRDWPLRKAVFRALHPELVLREV